MRSSRRGLAAIVSTTLVALSVPVLAVLGLPGAAQAAAPGDIKITEWAYNGSEFFELTNLGLGAQDLAGWSYADSGTAAGAVDLSAFGQVASGESVILAEDAAATFRTAWGLADTVKVIGGNTVNLGRSDQIKVYDETDTLVDQLTYNDQALDGPTKGPRTDTSSAWVPLAAVGANTASAWQRSTLADAEGSWERLPAASGFFGSPGTSTLAPETPGDGVVLNEVKSNPNPDFVELLNTSDEPVDITGWTAKDDAVVTPLVITTEPTVLEPGGYFVFNPNDEAVYGAEAAFGLGSNDQITILLPDGETLVDEFSWEGIGAPSNHAQPSYGRCPNGAGDIVQNLTATPGAANDCPAPEAPEDIVKINEIESNGDVVGDWVELTNVGESPVDVSGWKVHDTSANPAIAVPSGTTIDPGGFYAIYTEIPPPGFGLGAEDTVTLYLADGTTEVDSYGWIGGHAATTYGRCPDGSGDFEVTTVSTRGAANACSPIRINEVATPDQVELVNISDAPVDVAGWVVKDSTDADPTTLPAPSVVPAHGHLVVDPAAPLGSADSVRLFDTASKQIDSVTWTSTPEPSIGRCSDGVGTFKTTGSATFGSENDCPGLATGPWPGSQVVEVSDQAGTFNADASGLAFDPANPGTLWVAQNKLGTLWKMAKSGDEWVPASGWTGGKTPKYAAGTGAPDTEGVTVGPDGGVYLSSERDNGASGISKNTILRYDAASAAGATLNATDEWDLNTVLGLPGGFGANLGLEGITWVPDSYLLDGDFVDESTAAAYDPDDYPAHGTGLYVVGIEGTGLLYVLALDQTAAVQETAHLVATVDPELVTNAGPAGVMDVSFDAELDRLWAICDDSCDGTSVRMTLTDGAFTVEHAYERPVTMPNLNNEGFALAPQSTCVDGVKEVVWADDGDTDGHSLRSSTFPCHSLSEVSATGESVAYGQAAAIDVEVTATGADATGDVVLLDGDTELDSAELADGAATLAVPAKAYQPGVHAFRVEYSGDEVVEASDGEVDLTVSKATSTVSATGGSVVYGQTLSIPVQVGAADVTPTGSVTVRNGATVLGTAALAAGVTSVTVPAKSLAPGSHTLTVAYAGDDFVATASSSATVTVTKAAASVSGSNASAVYGQATSVPVTVSATGATTATGTVTLLAGGTPLGSAALAGGSATVAVPAKALAPGAHTLTVAYAGDDLVSTATGSVTVTVTKAAASIAKPKVTPAKVIAGRTVVKVEVDVNAAGLTPTGKVTITGGGVKETATLRNGRIQINLGKLKTKGTKTLTVRYLGDSFVEGASTKVKVKVLPKPKRR